MQASKLFILLSLGICAESAVAQSGFFLGLDRNQYPGDPNLATLRRTFNYTGYWLNNPPGETTNSWAGKRDVVRNVGLGFLVLFNGRLDDQLRRKAAALGRLDGEAAIAAAKHEGFPAHTIIFLDIEEGGRMSPQQKAYIYAWVDAIVAGGFRAGVYCSGIPVREDKNTTIVTADDIRADGKGREIAYWVTNDVCPPSPGCTTSQLPSPAQSGLQYADVWQFVQSPRRLEFAGKCRNYHPDGNCYPPVVDASSHLHIDLNTATSADPSHGR